MSTVGDAREVVLTSQLPPGLPAAPGSPEAAIAAGIGAGDVWRVIKQRKLLIAITFCVLYMLVIGATVLVYRYAPRYRSEAYILLIPPAKDWAMTEQQILPKDYILHQLATEAARVRDPQLLMEVLAQPGIKATSYYQWFGDDFEECLSDFRKRIGAGPVRDTYLIKIGISVKDKTEATLLVNTLVQRYLARSKSALTDEGWERLEALKNRRAKVEKGLHDKRDQIATARAQRDMPALESDRAVQVEQISMLSNTISELKTRDSDIAAQLETIHGVDPRNLPLSAEMRVIIESDPILRYYRNQVEQFEISIAVGKKNLMGEQHRSMQMLVDQREAFFEKEVARREELIQDLRGRQVESLSQERARIRNMMTTIREQLAEREAIQKDLDQTIQLLAGWAKDELMLQGELEQVGRALLEAESRFGVTAKEGRLKLAIAPRDATRPSRPNFITWLGGGFVLAFLASLGLAFLREFTDQALRTPIDVTRYGHLSVLGCIPLLDDEEADIDELELATRQAPQSLVAEAFRQVRAHMTFSGPHESQRALLITSPRPDDGKTAVAVNLAVTFAQGNERTLLIDCNFRRPGVRRTFANTRSEGLSNVLVGHSRFEDVVSGTELSKLDVLTSGPMPPNPAELLGSPQMRELLVDAKTKYDRVILDGPPCLLISDALVIATQTDAVVMVARAVNGTKGTLKRAREQFQRINARVIGAVLNGVETRPGGYFRQQYREFYDYMDEEVVLRELPEGPPEIDAVDALDQDKPDQT
ncbi:MAG: polysaccharide biosynthesis tyrosine autokinase [Phycisphaerae bacterium]|nr:polysaccharide biosynthesis tyrosine autokinase [Phycisphaerae bacterium]